MVMAPATLLAVPHGDPARRALWDAVDAAQADDPLAPVTVAVPSPHCGLSLRRERGRSGLVNVRFLALARIAELLGAPSLAASGRRPLTAAIRAETVHAVLSAAPDWLAPVAGHPSTEERLAASFVDLERAGGEARRVLTAGGGRVADVVRLFEEFRARTTPFYDEEEVVAAAAEVVTDGGAASRDEIGHVVVHLPIALSPAEEALLHALAAAQRVTVILGLTGDHEVDEAHAGALAARLAPALGEANVEPPRTGIPLATRVLRAPDPDDEVRAVVRDLLARAAAGTPLHRMAVLYRTTEPYARIVGEVLTTAGLPWSGPSRRRLADSVVGRVLRGLLELADRDFARDAVAAWLVSGPIVDPVDGRLVDAARWDVVSRQAGVVAGTSQWGERLGHHTAGLDDRLAAARGDDDVPEWQIHRLESDREHATRLAAFVADLTTSIEPPQQSSWTALAAWVTMLVERYVGAETRRGSWPDVELEAGRRVVEALRELGSLDAVGADVDVARFRHAVTVALDVPGERVGTFGTGVFVGSTSQAYGTSFDAVFVLGAVEGAFPPRGREDPLLPDADRRAAGNLELHAQRRLDERRDYLALLAAAPERVLCFPRADPRAQRKRLPARWVLESAEHLHGGPLTAEALRALVSSDWLHVVQSFEQGFTEDGDAVSVGERDLRSLRDWRTSDAPLREHSLVVGDFADGFAAQAARASRRVTEFDGLVGVRPELAPGADRPVSPTALQDWASCPFRYLLGSVLRLREVPRPEVIDTISPLDEGSLVHAVLEEFVRGAPPRAPGEPWTESDRARLRAIAEAHCADAEARGVTGRRVQWLLARRRILQTVERFPAIDAAIRARSGAAPAPDGLELAFGLEGSPPVTLAVRGQPVAFRGRIDRVDRTPDGGRVVVYDYKTGKVPRSRSALDDDPVASGTRLQLPVYALAAAELVDARDAEAYYWYVHAPDPDQALVGYPVDAARRERFEEVAATIAGGIADGSFPAYPGEQSWDPIAMRESFESCTWCAFDRVCPVDRGQAWERKGDDPAYERLLSLDLPEGDEEEVV